MMVMMKMFWCSLLLLFVSVSACDYNCRDKPVFTPSRLVVKYGDPASATCVVCENDCLGTLFGLEISLGLKSGNDTTLVWTVQKMTEWNPSPYCYYNSVNGTQCCSQLPVTVYQPLQNVTLTVVNHTGPMFEHGQYTLQCTVQDVFPVEHLTVTFFRGQRVLSVFQLNTKQQNTPVTERFTLSINASEEDDGAQYWCKAQLELGSEGPWPPEVRTSQALIPTVHYGPYLKVSGNPESITITQGDTLQLNCTSVGNPLPSYNWLLPSAAPFSPNSSVLTITSAGFEHGGQYTCNVTSNSRVVIVDFSVEVRANYIPYVIAGTIILVALGFCGIITGYIHYYKNTRTGQYKLTDVFHFRSRHIPVPADMAM